MVSDWKTTVKVGFGERVRAIRHSINMSQEALAEACDLDRTYIGSVERGERNLSLVNIYKIAKALKVEPMKFFESER